MRNTQNFSCVSKKIQIIKIAGLMLIFLNLKSKVFHFFSSSIQPQQTVLELGQEAIAGLLDVAEQHVKKKNDVI